MKLRKGSSNTSIKLDGSSVGVLFRKIPTLLDGGVEPTWQVGTGKDAIQKSASATYSWPKFYEDGSDGFGLTITGDTSDSRIATSRIPARFLTPFQVGDDEVEYVDILVHPYSGTDASDADNDVTVYVYLNGGSPSIAAKRTIAGGRLDGLQVYSAKLPDSLSFDVNEVRAIVMPRKGRPEILQVAGMLSSDKRTDLPIDPANTWSVGDRGVLVVKYSDITLGAETATTITSAVAYAGHSRIRCDGSSIFTAESPGTYEAISYNNSSLDGDPYFVFPVVTNGTINPSSHSSYFNMCLHAKDCAFVVDTNLAASNERYFLRGGGEWRGPWHQFRNCTFSVENDTTYSGTVTSSALGASILAKGFGQMLRAYDLGQTPLAFVVAPYDNTGNGYVGTFHDCTFTYCCAPGNEHIGSIVYGTPPSNLWCFGRPSLLVGCSEYGLSKNMFPWGSIGSDQITYSMDWSKYGTASVSSLPNSGTMTPSFSTVSSAISAVNGSLNPADGIDEGVWPDWLFSTGINSVDFNTLYDPDDDGTYVDHYGVSYVGWTKWGLGGTFSSSFDIHLDTVNCFSFFPGSSLYCGIRSYGNSLNRQVCYISNNRMDAVASWDWVVTENSSNQYEISIGAETRTGTLPYQTGGNGSQFWGPGFLVVDKAGNSIATQDFRGFIVGDENDVRGFSYIGDAAYTETAAVRTKMYSIPNATDDGTSRVIQGVNAVVGDNNGTDNWWVVNLSR